MAIRSFITMETRFTHGTLSPVCMCCASDGQTVEKDKRLSIVLLYLYRPQCRNDREAIA